MTTKNTKTNIVLTPAEVMAIDLQNLVNKTNARKVRAGSSRKGN